MFEQISDQNYFGNVLCKVHRTSLFHHKFFLHDEKTSENLSFICRLCQARQIAETKIWWDTLSIPSSALTAPKIILVFLKLSILKTLKLFEQISDQNYFGNVLCKVHRTSLFITNFFLHDEKTSEILVLFVDFAKLDK